ncbi:MAG: hypothetical protein J0M15_15000 [Deltaproteobacteria bacterium]|nr:hypothetical protein [Deltaproteobacteria bacterium]
MIKKILTFIFVFISFVSANDICRQFYLKKSFDAQIDHTIENLPIYVEDNLGALFIKNISQGKKVFIILGDGFEAREKLQSEGFTNIQSIEKRVGFHQTWTAIKNGEAVLVVTRVNGVDRVEHIVSFFDLLNVQPKIEFIGQHRSWKAEYLNLFTKIGPPPDLAVIGFSNTFTQSLLPISSFLLNPRLAWQRLNALRQKKRTGGTSDISTLPVQVVKLKNGQRIWFFQNVYGDLVLDIAKALDQFGVKNILYAGTAGSVNENFPVGRIVQPTEWLDENKILHPITWNSKLSGVDRVGRYTRVSTPNVETKDWLRKQILDRIDLIEVEVGHLLKFFSNNHETDFDAVLVVSDILVGNNKKDLTSWTKKNLVGLLTPFKKIIAQKLKTSDSNLDVQSYEVFTP